jgi:hypothetical protein
MHVYRCVHALPYGNRVEGEHADNNLKRIIHEQLLPVNLNLLRLLAYSGCAYTGEVFSASLANRAKSFYCS